MKAISPVIAIILLVMISVAASVFLWVWLSGYVTGASSEVETGTETVKASIKIDGVKYDPSMKRVYIYVTNIGDVATTITSLYVLGPTGNIIGAYTKANEQLDPGETRYIYVRLNSLLTPGTYVAKAVTTEGVEAVYTFVTEKVAVEITRVKYDSANKKVYIYVTNIGDAATNITAAYVLDEDGNVIGKYENAKKRLQPGETKYVYVEAELNQGQYYIAKVVTIEDFVATRRFKA